MQKDTNRGLGRKVHNSKSRVRRDARRRRKVGVSKKLASSTLPRLVVYRSAKFTYAQLREQETGKVLFASSTRDKDVLANVDSIDVDGIASDAKSPKSVRAAKALGVRIAELCKAKQIAKVAFHRNGYLYHGRVKAVADGARDGGLGF